MILVFVISASLYRSILEFKSYPSPINAPIQEIKRIVTPNVHTVPIKSPQSVTELPKKEYINQGFNNCGPATLAMVLNWHGKNSNQEDLGQELRPYQNPIGDNDDKSVFLQEFEPVIKRYDLQSYYRVNGTIDLLKLFVANDLPVIVRTWLHPDEDIGHFKIVRGFDNTRNVVIHDDSYEGPDIELDYKTFEDMWQPFNSEYLVVFPADKKPIVDAILKDEADLDTAYKNSTKRSQEMLQNNPENIYAHFNLSTAYYHLGDYQQSVNHFERVQYQLPSRMLWYQIEPIQSLHKTKKYDKTLALIDTILNNQNRGFSELYDIKGDIAQEQGNVEKAKEEFQLALFYNKNYSEAIRKLETLN